MKFVIFSCFLWVFVGIAVFTAVQTGIVSANVPVFDTVAALSCALVLQLPEPDTVGVPQHISRYAAGGPDMIAGKIAF